MYLIRPPLALSRARLFQSLPCSLKYAPMTAWSSDRYFSWMAAFGWVRLLYQRVYAESISKVVPLRLLNTRAVRDTHSLGVTTRKGFLLVAILLLSPLSGV